MNTMLSAWWCLIHVANFRSAASQVLSIGGYQQIRRRVPDWDTLTSRLFEDEYNVVGVVVFNTCGELPICSFSGSLYRRLPANPAQSSRLGYTHVATL